MAVSEIRLCENQADSYLAITPLDGDIPLGIAVGTIVSDEVNIEHFLVYEDYQGQRIGTKLLRRLIAWGQEQNAKQIVFRHPDKTDLVRFFQKYDFTLESPTRLAKPL